MIVRKKDVKPKGWFESFIDDTNIIEKLFFLIWLGVIGIFYIMFDGFDIWIRIASSVSIFIVLSLLVYGFAIFMSSDERDWNR